MLDEVFYVNNEYRWVPIRNFNLFDELQINIVISAMYLIGFVCFKLLLLPHIFFIVQQFTTSYSGFKIFKTFQNPILYTFLHTVSWQRS